MASAGLRKELECSICLSLYTDPVTLRCGHNFCRVCVDQVLNTQEGSGVYSCPECRAEFQERPELKKNITLCNVVENVQTTQPHQEKTEIFCTYCVDSPVPAAKSCLMCEASFCDKHLRVHSKGPEHVLTEPSTDLEKRKCPVHKKVLEYYCTEDSACICVSCSLAGKHRGHRVEMLDEASEKKKKKLKDFLQKLTTKREKTEERVQSLEERRRKAQEKASGEAERVTALFIDIRKRLDDLEKKILSEISRQDEQRSLSLSDVIQKLEIKKDELSRKMQHIEELCKMSDPLTVLQDPDTGDLCDPEAGGDDGGNKDTVGHGRGDQDVKLMLDMSHTLSDIIRGINATFYMQGPLDILLDVNTASNNIIVTEDLKMTFRVGVNQKVPETAKRFQYNQVMSVNSISSGRHYWDMEIIGTFSWCFGMCYPSIDRRGNVPYTGNNNKSWSFYSKFSSNIPCAVIHDSKMIQLPHQISTYRVRVYVDYEAGQLSFYELCDPIRHLYTFFTTFTEPLHASFSTAFMQEIPGADDVVRLRSHLHLMGPENCDPHTNNPESPRNTREISVLSSDKPQEIYLRTTLLGCGYQENVEKTFRRINPNRNLRIVVEHILSTDPHQITGICCTYCIHSPVYAVKNLYVRTTGESTARDQKTQHQGHKMEFSDREFRKRKQITKTEETDKRRRQPQESRSDGRVTALFTDIRSLLDDLEKRVHNEISRKTEQESLSDVTLRLEIKDKLVRRMEEPDTSDVRDPEEGDEDTRGHDGCNKDTKGHNRGEEGTGGHHGYDEDTGGHNRGDLATELISHVSSTLPDIIRGVNVTFYVQEPADILLDVHTAANNIDISDDQKTATWTGEIKNRPKTAERFQYNQVMSRNSITSGRHYWDVEISGSKEWRVEMCYPSIDRRGRQSYTGDNNKSWGLNGGLVLGKRCAVRHNSEVIRLPHWISSNRFRVYVDYEAGQLSFYELCDPIRHLYTFTTTFTEPLHAALWICEGSIKIPERAAAERTYHHRRNLPRLW
ncbi:uncharacterized protein LOC142204634 [Leptodactylus fuscus]|uniref:uncharacterized protein LOC142204634 n=1 Tax=Leptodactylus fuscus TaxID=238119 RepID=UPI003F4EEFAB